MILFIKNISIEGPERLESHMSARGFQTRVIDLSRGDTVPEDPAEFDAIVVLGGPMNVDEESKFPYLKSEKELIRAALQRNVPLMGICLGAQLLARVCGAEVIASSRREVGVFPVQLTPEGQTDPLFAGVPREYPVYQWHEDMFEIPKGAARLAESGFCPNQAFRVGQAAYGLQFHMEICPENIREWAENYWDLSEAGPRKDYEKMIRDFKGSQTAIYQASEAVFDNFVTVIQNRNRG